MRATFGALIMLGSLLLARPAAAEFVCQVAMSPGTGPNGNVGFVIYHGYTGPACTGTFLGFREFCSAGATSRSCSNQASDVYTEADLNALYEMLTQALIWQYRVGLNTAPCKVTGSGCAGSVWLHAN